MTLCETFRQLSFQTWAYMVKAKLVSHQPLEETITDNLLIELKTVHPNKVITKTFTRREEASTGADWEWWFTDHSKNNWFGVRVQAKILKHTTNKFEALNYKTQTNVLIDDAEKNGLVPLYCFYSSWDIQTNMRLPFSNFFALPNELWGCSLVDAYTIKKNKSSGNINSLSNIMKLACPWSCLVCTEGSTRDLPNIVKNHIKSFMLREHIEKEEKFKIIKTPPRYILNMIENDSDIEAEDSNLAGVVLFIGSNG